MSCSGFGSTFVNCELFWFYVCMSKPLDIYRAFRETFGIYRAFPKPLDIYRGFRKHSIFTVGFENTQFYIYVKPYLLDIYRRFETYTENAPPKKVVRWKKFLYVRPLFARYLPQTSIHTFVCNN